MINRIKGDNTTGEHTTDGVGGRPYFFWKIFLKNFKSTTVRPFLTLFNAPSPWGLRRWGGIPTPMFHVKHNVNDCRINNH